MRYPCALALPVLLAISPAAAVAQMPGMPSGGMPMDGSGMTPDQAQRMADEMLLKFGARIGIDPEALKNATPEEREEMLRGGADAMAGQTRQRMERMFGMSMEEMRNADPADLRARMMARVRSAAEPPPIEPRPLPPAPPRGFPDGSVPLPVAPDYTAELVYDEPPQRALLLVAADVAAREIVWRATRTTPIAEPLSLTDLAPDPSVLILELIDLETHRVVRRYRPVRAEKD